MKEIFGNLQVKIENMGSTEYCLQDSNDKNGVTTEQKTWIKLGICLVYFNL